MKYEIHRIKRSKLNGLGLHYGVVRVSVFRPGLVDVIDLGKNNGIQHYESIEDWARGRPWKAEDQVSDEGLSDAIERMRQAIEEHKGYDLFLNNSEHFASWGSGRKKGDRPSFSAGRQPSALCCWPSSWGRGN